jgi:hypothetical protein
MQGFNDRGADPPTFNGNVETPDITASCFPGYTQGGSADVYYCDGSGSGKTGVWACRTPPCGMTCTPVHCAKALPGALHTAV